MKHNKWVNTDIFSSFPFWVATPLSLNKRNKVMSKIWYVDDGPRTGTAKAYGVPVSFSEFKEVFGRHAVKCSSKEP